MPENSSKTPGRLSSLIRWELEKTFTFPTLAIIIAVVLYITVPASFGGSRGPSQMPSLVEMERSFASSWTSALSHNVSTSFMYSVFIFAALASNSLSRDMSRGYMRVLLSYPIGRTKFFLSKILVLLFVPFFIFMCCLLFVAALVFPGLFLHMPPSSVAYMMVVMLVQTFFILAISLSASLYIKQPVMSFLASVVTLIAMDQISFYLSAPYKYLLPTMGTRILMDYHFYPSRFEFQYTSGDLLMSLFGMVIVPAVILIVNLVYFKRRFQT